MRFHLVGAAQKDRHELRSPKYAKNFYSSRTRPVAALLRFSSHHRCPLRLLVEHAKRLNLRPLRKQKGGTKRGIHFDHQSFRMSITAREMNGNLREVERHRFGSGDAPHGSKEARSVRITNGMVAAIRFSKGTHLTSTQKLEADSADGSSLSKKKASETGAVERTELCRASMPGPENRGCWVGSRLIRVLLTLWAKSRVQQFREVKHPFLNPELLTI